MDKLMYECNMFNDFSMFDFLIGLYNCCGLQNCFDILLVLDGDNYYVLFFDIDYFKVYNDYYGYMMGDQVFICVFVVICNVVCLCDIVVCFGGEEFMVLLINSSEEMVWKIVECICQWVYDLKILYMFNESVVINVIISIGLMLFINDNIE